VRNIFENLSQNALADQQQLSTPKKPSKWEKPAVQKSVNISGASDIQSMSSDDHNLYTSSDVDGDHEPVHGTSTVYVVDAELPPPAFTRNIVAKFRELEANSVDKTVPLPGKGTSTPSRSTHSQSSNLLSHTYQPSQHSDAVTEDDYADGSQRFSESIGRQTSDERGRTKTRSEVRQRELSSSPGQTVENDLPQEGTARSLLARWRTIEQEACHSKDDAPRRSSAAATRSQSTSRIEVRRLYKATRPAADDDDEQGLSTRYLAILKVKRFNQFKFIFCTKLCCEIL